jgi:hypothetical protein
MSLNFLPDSFEENHKSRLVPLVGPDAIKGEANYGKEYARDIYMILLANITKITQIVHGQLPFR